MNRNKVRYYREKLGHLSAPQVLKLIKSAGIDESDLPAQATIRRILSGKSSRISRRMERILDLTLEQQLGGSDGVSVELGSLGPLPVPIIGKTRGFNVIHAISIDDVERQVFVPLLMYEQARQATVDVDQTVQTFTPFRGVMFTSAGAPRSPCDWDEDGLDESNANRAINGMVAIFDQSRPIKIEQLLDGRRDRILVVLECSEEIPELTARGAAAAAWVCAWASVTRHGEVLALHNANGAAFASVKRNQIANIWRVLSIIP